MNDQSDSALLKCCDSLHWDKQQSKKYPCDLLEDKITEVVVYFVSHDLVNLWKKRHGVGELVNEYVRWQFTM